MAPPGHVTLRTVVLAAPGMPPSDMPTGKLLGEMGHDVTPVSSTDQAMRALQSGGTDLLVVDVSNSTENQDFVRRLADLPQSQRPRELAVFSNWIDSELAALRKRIAPSHVHVFLKPLHVHGLLHLLRQIHADEGMAATA